MFTLHQQLITVNSAMSLVLHAKLFGYQFAVKIKWFYSIHLMVEIECGFNFHH